jgi:hypothetical protein
LLLFARHQLEKQESGDVAGIDALVGCPVSLPPASFLAGDDFWKAPTAARERVALV